jgi:hypothetical protein
LSDTQFYISVAVMPVTTITIVLIGVVLNNVNMNARFADMSAHFNDRFAQMDARFADLKGLIQAYSDRQDANLRRVEDELLGKFAELNNRLNRIEHHLNLG